MKKQQVSKITDLHNVEISNIDSFGHKMELVFTGRNSAGKLVKFKIESEVWFAKHIAQDCKKAVKNFVRRANDIETDFNAHMNQE